MLRIRKKISEKEQNIVSHVIINILKVKSPEKVGLKLKNSLKQPRLNLNELIIEINDGFNLKQKGQLIYILLQLVYADDVADKNERYFISYLSKELNMSKTYFNTIVNSFMKQKYGPNWKNEKDEEQNYTNGQDEKSYHPNSNLSLESAFMNLGLNSDASEHEIKAAYRKLAKKYHPDKNINQSEHMKEQAEAHFVQLTKAYEEIKMAKGIV
jgi:DnaJ like chaperone protein